MTFDFVHVVDNKMNILIIVLIFFNPYSAYSYTVAVPEPEYKTYKDYKLFQIENEFEVNDLIQKMKMLDKSLIYEVKGDITEVLVSPDHLQQFEDISGQKNLNVKLVVEDISKIIEEERNINNHLRSERKGFSWDAYYDVDDIYAYLKNMSATYPEWVQLVEGGESHEGRKILGLKIDTRQKGYNDTKLAVFIESGIHAREWIAPASATYFINQLLTSKDKDILNLRDLFQWHIFPTVNPDGYHHSHIKERLWRKNRAKPPNGSRCYGVDGNRNWEYNWMQQGSSDDPCAEVYAGTSAFSEKETKSLSNYISQVDKLLAYISFHSYGPMLLLPYSDSRKHFDNYDDLVKMGNAGKEYGEKLNLGNSYRGPATAAELIYKASGSSVDWVRQIRKVPIAMTFEFRGEMFIWPQDKIRQHGDEVTQMLLGIFTEAKKLGYYK